MGNKETIQENKKRMRRKIKVNVHYRVTKFRFFFIFKAY